MTEKAYLHDADIESVEIDIIKRILRIRVNRYVDASQRDRVQSVVEFRNVKSYPEIADLMALASNAWSGKIEDWDPSSGVGVSHLHFARGKLSIHSDEPVVL